MSTQLIRALYNVTPVQQGGVLTIGNFDGVHVGHQALMTKVSEEAQRRHAPSVVITFEPHPFEYFHAGEVKIPRITRLREKFLALAECGVNNVLILPFNQEVAKISASDFVTKILYEKLRPQHVIIGDDFHFGHQRQGNFALLKKMGERLNFTVEALPTILIDGERVSSTRLRQALKIDDQALVQRLLGHAYKMHGRIRRGDQLGRQWGFPTANIYVHRHLTPVSGVYTVYMHGIDAQPLPGVANIGTRPTVGGTRCLLEVHLLNFDKNIYGRYVQVEFCKKLREEIRYPNVDLLKAQIAEDVLAAKDYFNLPK